MKKITFLCVICVSSLSFAQHKFLSPPEFNQADLTKAKSAINADAPAEILYRSVHYRIDDYGMIDKMYHYRIKIYDKEKSEELLNLEIPLAYSRNMGSEKISQLKALTYNLENGSVVTTKVENSSKYKSKEDKYITVNKLAFPNVKDGSIIEYSYKVASPFVYALPEVTIELDIPSAYTEFVFETPVNMAYRLSYLGDISPTYTEDTRNKNHESMYNTYRIGFVNLKKFVTEDFVKNPDNYRAKVRGELHSAAFKDVTEYSSTWKNISERLQKDEEFGGELGKQKLARNMMPAEVASATTAKDKADLVFRTVQKSFTWDQNRGIFTDQGFKKLLETKTGNAPDINLFLVAMLREAGLEANPLLISTVDNGLLDINSPNIASLNFVLAVVEDAGQYYIYDATSKQSSANNLPPRDWNNKGVIMKKKDAQPVSMMNYAQSVNTLKLDVSIGEDGTITGTYSDKDTGAFAMRAKERYDENSEKYKKLYPENFGINFTSINPQTLENGDFESSMKFEMPNAVDRVGQKMILNPMMFLAKSKNEFDQSGTRLYPIDFIAPFVREKRVEIKIPQGYTVEELPKPKQIVTDDKEIKYSYNAQQKGDVLEIFSKVEVASAEYQKEYYPAFKQIWATILKAENQAISLKKK